MRDVKRQEIITDEVCDKCGAKMAIKFGRFGQFLACTNYPECKSTRELARPGAPTGQAEPERRLPKIPTPTRLRELRKRDGAQARPLRSVPGVHRLSELQNDTTHLKVWCRCCTSGNAR